MSSFVLLSLCSQLDLLEAVRTSRKDINLGPRSGPKIRSGVMTPKGPSKPDETLTTKRSNSEQLKDPELPWDSNNAEVEMPDKLASKSQVVDEMIDLDDF